MGGIKPCRGDIPYSPSFSSCQCDCDCDCEVGIVDAADFDGTHPSVAGICRIERAMARSLSDIAFVTRRRRCGQMQGRRPGKTGGVFTGIR